MEVTRWRPRRRAFDVWVSAVFLRGCTCALFPVVARGSGLVLALVAVLCRVGRWLFLVVFAACCSSQLAEPCCLAGGSAGEI